ncbi:uncharacterized protein LOC142165388 [Nicotiana tabacum]|uniref:Uncharacterized protein LOC142165388 n=1 Tax=Nicotiana tabacum TaxID=4097 RepID=A0AC58S532_TOBAC
MDIAWITNSLSKDIENSVICFDTIKDIWVDINERFGTSNGSKYIQLQREISDGSQGSLDIATYFIKLRGLWDELNTTYVGLVCTYGALPKFIEQQKIYQFLSGLNESYSTCKSNILIMPTLPSLSKAYSMLQYDEKQKETSALIPSFQMSLPLSMLIAMLFITTLYCKTTSHIIEKCYKLHGFPPDFKFTKSKRSVACVQSEGPFSEEATGNCSVQCNASSPSFSVLPDSTTHCNTCNSPDINKTYLFWHQRLGHMARYCLTLVDDFTRVTWTHLLSCKNNALSVLKAFISMVKFHFKSTVQSLRSANAYELGSSAEAQQDVFFPEHMFPYHLPPSSTFPSPTFDFTDAPTPTSFVPSPAPVSLSPAPVSLSPAPVSSSLGVFSSPHSSSIHVPPPPVLRRFGRTVNPSIYFNDYVCSYVLPSSSVSLNPKVSTSDLHMLEPQFYQHTASHSTWQEAMLKEFEALEANHTWELSPCLLIRKLSHASGYTRSSRNLMHTTVKCLLFLAVKRHWTIFQLDVNNVFLYGDLHEEVYIRIPHGLQISFSSSSSTSPLVCRLRKSLYGLKQASRQWFSKLSDALLSKGYIANKKDYSLFTKSSSDSLVVLVVVDDILLDGADIAEMTALKQFLDD